MLPPFIIEQIRKREQEERERQAERQPQLEIPLEPFRRREAPNGDVDDDQRGVVIVELGAASVF